MAKRSTPRSVLITGASSGIGRALALEYGKRGAHVVVTARREPELVSLCEEIRGAGGRADHLVCDVADPVAAHAVAKRGEEILGSLDMIVANAGVGASSHASRLSLEDVVRTIDVNVRGAMATLMGAIPIMLGQKHGHLVGVSSLAGRRALPGSADYSASKAALTVFLEGLRLDLSRAGIDVTDVQPGFVETPMTSKNDFPMPFIWDAAKAATYVADGLERAPAMVAFPPPLRFLTRLAQLLPFSVHAFATRRAARRSTKRNG
ncbi:MAG: SDR family NAD(P)-dependent oxidoreductase [Labilithrix sp.]|nr:SDR family NAD(P)-dependent oxidoreductase [Labilithrix sp.]